MSRIQLLCLALLSTAAVSPIAAAGPLSVNPQRGALYTTQPTEYAPRQARSEYGGGFIEFLFRGPSALANAPRYDARGYRPGDPDLGPGMVEAPGDPSRAVMDARFQKQEVAYDGEEKAGTIIVHTRERMLYLVQDSGRAIRYGIGVGRPGFTWSGVHHVTQKREWPDWTPPDEMLRRRPDLPRHMVGGPDNPLGARALYLGSTLYRIHGSNEPWTIGTQVSSGCIRMRNEDVIDLYGRVRVGAKVVVI
ncbi:MAG: L,D-transpeptidase [Hyphomicrobiales bacterium]|nr:L,D-transpeptidase [Hyphomicrobiales bacterium]